MEPRARWIEHARTPLLMELRGAARDAPTLGLTTRRVGAIIAWHWTSSAVEGARTSAHIAQDDRELLLLWLGAAGAATVADAGAAVRIAPGDLTVLSSSRPHRIAIADRHEAYVFAIPRTLLEPHAGRLEAKVLSTALDPVAVGAAVPALVRLGEAAARGELGPADADYGELVVAVAGALSATRHGAAVAAAAVSGARGVLLLSQAKAYIERHLQDPDLGPAEVAAAQHISVRYLQKLFQSEGTTMLAWTRSTRLRRARRDLADPGQAPRTVAEIARSHGFRHPGHFRRAFSEEFGITPARFRRGTLHGA